MRIGTDIIELCRIEKAYQRRASFRDRILTDGEQEFFKTLTSHRQIEFLAGRFAAKEAYGKALKTGVGTSLKFTDIEILYDETRAPKIISGPIINGVEISISHSSEYAIAMVLIDQSESEIEKQLTAFKRLKEEQSDSNK